MSSECDAPTRPRHRVNAKFSAWLKVRPPVFCSGAAVEATFAPTIAPYPPVERLCPMHVDPLIAPRAFRRTRPKALIDGGRLVDIDSDDDRIQCDARGCPAIVAGRFGDDG